MSKGQPLIFNNGWPALISVSMPFLLSSQTHQPVLTGLCPELSLASKALFVKLADPVDL